MAANISCHWTVVNTLIFNQTFPDIMPIHARQLIFPSLNKEIDLIMAMRVYLPMLHLKMG